MKPFPMLQFSIKLNEFCNMIIFQNLFVAILATGLPVNDVKKYHYRPLN